MSNDVVISEDYVRRIEQVIKEQEETISRKDIVITQRDCEIERKSRIINDLKEELLNTFRKLFGKLEFYK
jgi:hypothetical protein